jgi:hypothetical protein
VEPQIRNAVERVDGVTIVGIGVLAFQLGRLNQTGGDLTIREPSPTARKAMTPVALGELIEERPAGTTKTSRAGLADTAVAISTHEPCNTDRGLHASCAPRLEARKSFIAATRECSRPAKNVPTGEFIAPAERWLPMT